MTRSLQAGIFCLLVAVVGSSAAEDSSAGFAPETWEQGAEGLFGAIRTLEEGDHTVPMVVYFYTDWCGYCRQFERELLGKEKVRGYFEDLLAVRINPEKGDQERQVAEYYGVNGYPAFFVHSSRSRTLSRVERMVVENGQPRLKSEDEFLRAVAEAAAR